MKNLVTWWINARIVAISCLTTGVVTGVGLSTLLFLPIFCGPPIIEHRVDQVDEVVINDNKLNIVYTPERNQCQSKINRVLWTEFNHNGSKLKFVVPINVDMSGVPRIDDKNEFILSIPLPHNVWPGKWHYSAETTKKCNSIWPEIFNPSEHESVNIPLMVVNDNYHSTMNYSDRIISGTYIRD